jgi:hypothetical protein
MFDTEAAPCARLRCLWVAMVRVRWWSAAFAVLCVLASSRWILADQWQAMGSTLWTEAWACGLTAFVVAVVAIAEKRRLPRVWIVVELLAIGAGLLAAPELGAVLHGPASGALDRTIALCFVPVIVTVVAGIWSEGASSSSLWPGLAGLGGALLVFPVALPSSVPGWVGLVVPPIAVSAACVACQRVARGLDAVWCATLLLAGGTVCLALMGAVSGGFAAESFSMWAVVLDLAVAGLVVFVVLRIDALRYVSRYFFVPLLSIVEGLILLRSGVTLRQGFGLALLAAGSAALVRGRGTDGGTSGLRLR